MVFLCELFRLTFAFSFITFQEFIRRIFITLNKQKMRSYRKRQILALIFFTLNTIYLFGQTRTVSGVVTENGGEPLIGVSVLIKGTAKGTVTDIDGKYSLVDVPQNASLLFSYIGFETKELPANSSTINVVLTSDEQLLDEVIVVAYGKASKAGFTGSASSVNKSEIARSQVSSVSRLLQGSASGVQAIAASGQPGTDASVYIRGIGSINASSTPLYIVDGAPFDGSLNSINPADIESVSVLKDAASTALYGSRAGNGLIIITTKQGRKDDKVVIEANFKYGASSRAVDDYKKIGTNDYFQLYWEALRNQALYANNNTPEQAAKWASDNLVSQLGINPYGSAYPIPVDTDGKLQSGAEPLWNDDWTEEYTQNAHRTEAQLGISGGSKITTYYASLGYLDDQGIAIASDFKRYTGRLNLNSALKPWLRLNTGISLTHSKQNAPQSEDSNLANSLNFARMIPDFYPIWKRNEDGSFILENGQRVYDYGDYRPSSANPRYNHLGSSQYDFTRVTRELASIRGSLEIDIFEGLLYKGSINIDYTNRNNHNYINPEYGSSSYNENPGSVSKANYRTVGFTGNNLLTYTTTLNEAHNLKVMFGQEYYEYNTSYISGSRTGFPALGLNEPVAASELNSFTGNKDQYKLLSFFGNLEYNYNNKYYGSASIRRDASSRFSPDARWGTFWSVGVSWRLNEEAFLKNFSSLTKLTVRSSYGGQGNDDIGSYYAYKGLFAIRNNLGESGFVTSSLENNDLKWETNLNFNIGVDFGFFDNRLTGSTEYFNRRSKDLLFEIPKPLSTGYSSYSSNVGAMKNNGVEISLNGVLLKTKDWQWDLFANATHFRNKITALPSKEGQEDNSIVTGNYIRREGGSIYDFFLPEWAGVNPENGLPQWYKTEKDGNRVVTENYNEANTTASKIVAGTSLPDLSGGFGTNLKFKDFEFSALFAYSIGGKIYNGDKVSLLHNGSSAGRAMSVDLLDRWTPDNTNTNVPRLQTSNAYAWTSTSTRFLIDADYLRLKNLTLGYNLPENILRVIHVANLKIYAQAENLLTFFKEEGIDPEQTIGGSTYFRYPAMKTISFGVNLTF